MTQITRRNALALGTGLAASLSLSGLAQAQAKPVIKVASLTLPVFAPMVWNIMKARGLDEKHGFTLELKPYPSISGYYAAFATGEADAIIGGPTVFQKLSMEGVPVRIIGTAFSLADLIIFTRDPAIKSLADLKGKQLAADMGSAQFQIVKICAAARGIDLGKDITVVNANYAVSRAQLEAGRVDAAMVIEPLATIITKQNPDWKIIFSGAEAWKEATGQDGWELVPALRADAIARLPEAPKMLLAAMADVADVINKETAEADRIANETLKLPPGILTAAVQSRRLQVTVKSTADAATRKSITDMMERAVKAGFYDKMPDASIIYTP